MLDAITPKTRFIFIPNPNNPTGTLISQRNIDSFMSRVPDNIIVVFDEAYFEFLDDPPDTLQFVRDRPKRRCACARSRKFTDLPVCASATAWRAPDLIEVLHKTRQPFNVNSIAHAGAMAALDDEAHQRETKRVIDQGRAYLQEQFAEMKLPVCARSCKFCHGERRRRACGVPEVAGSGKSLCDRSKAMVCLNGSAFQWAQWSKTRNASER